MGAIEIRKYTPEDRGMWDAFVERARNATFLFQRGYMDYHADRFTDHSLIASQGGKTLALLPADITDDGWLHSHRGLTYGGWILPPGQTNGETLLQIFEETLEYCRKENMSGLDYKPLPFIYASEPSQEDIYALFRMGAKMSECNLSSAIDLLVPPPFHTLQRRLAKRADALAPKAECSPEKGEWDAYPFWNMLSECLAERHGAAPVHSAEELQMLRDRFPEQIRIWQALSPVTGKPAAGVCLFLTREVVHCQYICSTQEGRELNLLPWLFDRLIHQEYSDPQARGMSQRWFDFGTSNEDSGRVLNGGLLRQKFSFGATGVAYQRFRLEI